MPDEKKKLPDVKQPAKDFRIASESYSELLFSKKAAARKPATKKAAAKKSAAKKSGG